ncbi:rhodanese domain-containing protein CG4456-like isoform 2-T2 [Glossina fuscipes fuscipes]
MATFEEVRNVPNNPEVYLIDVRNADEVASTGLIPGSINIPSLRLHFLMPGCAALTTDTFQIMRSRKRG